MNSVFDDGNLFGDISVPGLRRPLGGVHLDVIRATRSRDKDVILWGIATTMNNEGWARGLSVQESIVELESRKVRAEVEAIVSRIVGDVWLTGASSLDRDEVIAMLQTQGYEQFSDETYPTQRIEKFRRK